MIDVVTIGLGYIGLPTSALMATKGKKVLGVDIDQDVVDTINKGDIHIIEPELDVVVKKSIDEGNLIASTKAEEAQVYLVVVPSPFKGDHEPDISFIEKATQGIIPLLKKGDLYILESTSPVGTTEKMQEMIFAQRPELKNKIFMAYCPERVLPGNVMHELVHNDRVIGGVNKASTQKAILFYSSFVEGALHPTDAKTAEMCKLVENASRDVQIAFANELSLICDKSGINVWDLIELANKHPRVNILQPGCGVGGHCIAVDPYFLTTSYPDVSKIIGEARKVNNNKAFWCVNKIEKEIVDFVLKNKRKPILALCGLAFKPNVNDLRQSPAKLIVNKVIQEKDLNNFRIVEPNIKEHHEFKLYSFEDAVSESDIVVFLVAHNEFSLSKTTNKKTLNFCNVK
jgi:UDP-N-acetyl-D-mannosaminuronic acid dehydrogenase